MFVRAGKWLNGLSASMSVIGHSELPIAMRKELARAALRLSVPKRLLPNPIRLMGYSISYFAVWELRYLFHEIFLAGTYQFATDRSQPLILDCGSNIGLSIFFSRNFTPKRGLLDSRPNP